MGWLDWLKLVLPYLGEMAAAIINALSNSHKTAVKNLQDRGLL